MGFRIVFMGTPDFAAASLRALLEAGHTVVLALTQPDKPKGRGYALTPSPVKELARAHGIPVHTPQTLRDGAAAALLAGAEADFFVVAAYGKILPKEILALPARGCVNVHASLLPRLRGAAPIQRAIINGDDTGGVTIMYMAEGIDTGDMILQKSTPIPADMDAGRYHDVLAALGAEALCEALARAAEGPLPRIPQEEARATYAPKLERADQRLTFRESARDTCNRIRGLYPAPCAFFTLGGMRIQAGAAHPGARSGACGVVLSTEGGLEIGVADGSVVLTSLKPAGKGFMDAESFLRGRKIEIGARVDG